MNKKIIAIRVISLFLPTSFTTASAITSNEDNIEFKEKAKIGQLAHPILNR